MADKQIPLFPKATSMFVHSGNIINWNRLKRKPNLSPTDEVNYDGLRLKSKYLKFEGATTSLEMGAIWRIFLKILKIHLKNPDFTPDRSICSCASVLKNSECFSPRNVWKCHKFHGKISICGKFLTAMGREKISNVKLVN